MPSHDFGELVAKYPEIIAQMPPRFTSHQFILELARQNQRLYKALYHYRNGDALFRTLCTNLARPQLSHNMQEVCQHPNLIAGGDMHVTRFDKATAKPAHNGTILAMEVLPPGVKAPFGHAWGYLEPHQAMEGHSHPTEEIYFFHQGQGVVVVGDEQRPVSPGDVVGIPPDTYHTVQNPSDGELYWFALWWRPLD